MSRILLTILLALGLAACHHTSDGAIEKEYITVNVPVPAPCPEKETYEAVKAKRPVPLRLQEPPATEADRQLAERRQLGRYEAPGGYSDQSWAVIESCYNRAPPLDPPP